MERKKADVLELEGIVEVNQEDMDKRLKKCYFRTSNNMNDGRE